jgi:eukaryotic-like serine/threonine-protein kinase
VRLTDLEGNETFPALSPDGNQFVYVKSVGGRSHIYWQRVGGGNPLDLSKDSSSDDTQPAYSPDGALIAFRSERDGGGLFLMGSTGESARRLTDFGYNPSWSPDGTEIACATEGTSDPRKRSARSQIWRVNQGGQKRLVSEADGVQPSWSPNGLRLAYWGREPGREARRTIWTIAATGGKATAVTNDDHLNWNPVWSPDGKYLYFASNRGGPMNFWRVAIDESTGKVLGDPEPRTTPAQWSALLSFSHDGREFAYATNEGKSNLERMDFDPATGRVSGTAVAVTAGSRAVDSFAVSPDSKWIVFATAAPQENLFVVHPDGTGSRQLTNDGFKNRVPRWSPDGWFIVFYSNRGGAFQAWSIRPDGSGLTLMSATNQLYNPVISPDAKTLACNVGTQYDLCLIDLLRPLGERRPTPLPRRDHSFSPFSWSPDGSRLVGLTDQPGIFVYSFPRHNYERLSADVAQFPVWLHDGRTVLYLGDGKVRLLDTATRRPRDVLAAPANSAFIAAAASPDDRVLYTLRSGQEGDIWLGRLR